MMPNREQQLIVAAMRYLELLEQGQVVNIGAYVATVEADLRTELAEYLELMLALGDITQPVVLTAEEQAMAERAATRARERWRQQLHAQTSKSISELRKEQRLSLGKVAKATNLPVDLLTRIERGGVLLTTIPQQLITRLARLLNQTEAAIQAALASPQRASSGLHLSAEDATAVQPEAVLSFEEALRASGATAQQREEWG